MIQFEMQLDNIMPLSRDQIIRLMQTTSRFESHVMILHRNRTINGKSMLGLLSLGDTGTEKVEWQFEGADEEAAALEVRGLLESGIQPVKDRQDAEILLGVLKEKLITLFGENLVGIYVHGSLAFGCFHWLTSDIDFLCVVKRPLALEEKVAFVELMEELSDDAPPKGFECSVLLEEVAKAMPYPAPFEVHFSNVWREAIRQDARNYCEEERPGDPDLTTHVLSLRHSCIAVHGPQVLRVFGPVKRDDCLMAMFQDSEGVLDKLRADPVYTVLNLCRALAFKEDGMVLSKPEGGSWALANLRPKYQSVIQAAVNAYNDGREMYYDFDIARDFCCVSVSMLLS